MLPPVGAALAQDVKLPSTLTFTAYDTGSSGFNIAVAVGKSLKDKNGTDVRVLPAGNDVARLAPLRADRAQASAMGIGTYFAPGGRVRVRGQGVGAAADQAACSPSRTATPSRSASPRTRASRRSRTCAASVSPWWSALRRSTRTPSAVLAFGGLTRNDVKLVEFSSYGAAWKGMVNNEVDAAIASNISGQVKEVETSPRGIVFPPTPAADKEGWARLNKIGPYFRPHNSTCGSGVPAGGSVELPAYPYPIFMAYASQPADLVYNLTKAMIANYDAYKDAAPGAAGLDVKRQNLAWVLPYHEGAVRALKEAGVWKPEHEAHNQALVKRQDTLAAAWAAFLKNNPPDDKDAFAKGWTAARKTALTAAGMDPVFE